jgi:pentatricopeptide repeat protein
MLHEFVVVGTQIWWRHVFYKMRRKNVITWNALIRGYGNHGQGEEAIQVFFEKI